MRLKVLIKLSSIFFLVGCAEPTKPISGTAQDTKVTTVSNTETDPYEGYNCSSVPTRDWVGDPHKSKAFLKMVVLKLNDLDIKGNYTGFDSKKSGCQLSINTNPNSLDIFTDNNRGVELDAHKDYVIQGFSCSDSKARYDLIFENTNNGSTKYLSLFFSPNTHVLNRVFFNTQSIDSNDSIFECNYLSQVSF